MNGDINLCIRQISILQGFRFLLSFLFFFFFNPRNNHQKQSDGYIFSEVRGTFRFCGTACPLGVCTFILGRLSNYYDDDDNFKKQYRSNDQSNSSACASRFLVHFFDVHCTTTT